MVNNLHPALTIDYQSASGTTPSPMRKHHILANLETMVSKWSSSPMNISRRRKYKTKRAINLQEKPIPVLRNI